MISGVSVIAMNPTKAAIAADVDDQDRERAADPGRDQPADRRVEQVDEQQADDERPDAVAGHPQEQAEDDRRDDQDGDSRRERDEAARVVAGGSTNGGGGRATGRASRGPRQRHPSGSCDAGSSIVPQTTRRGRARPERPRPAASVASPRQRWRLVLARGPDAPRLGGRELSDAWDAALEATGLPLASRRRRVEAQVAGRVRGAAAARDGGRARARGRRS